MPLSIRLQHSRMICLQGYEPFNFCYDWRTDTDWFLGMLVNDLTKGWRTSKTTPMQPDHQDSLQHSMVTYMYISRFMSLFSFCYDRRTDTCWQPPGRPTFADTSKARSRFIFERSNFRSFYFRMQNAHTKYTKICTVRNFPLYGTCIEVYGLVVCFAFYQE